MITIWNDIRYAMRGFRRTPLFTTVAIVSLAFGIGANTAIFSLLNQVLLRLLPVDRPEQLTLLNMKGDFIGSNWGEHSLSYPMYLDFKDHNQVFSGMFCRFPTQTSLGYGGHTELIDAELVSGTYFPVLGVKAAIGRTFTAKDDGVPRAPSLAMLSYGFWRSRFSADPNIVGKNIIVNGHSLTVVGVSQPGFDGVEPGRATQVFVPVTMKPLITPNWDGLKDRRQRWVQVFGRLRPGISLKQAAASLQPFMHSMLEQESKEAGMRNVSPFDRRQFLKSTIETLPGSQGRSSLRRDLATPLWVLMALTGTVLLLACANLANLLLARSTTREREFAIRLAIGAGRARVIRQLLIESTLLSALGALLGLLLAIWADRLLLTTYLPAESTGGLAISALPDWRVLSFTLAVMLLTAILFGLIPAFQSARSEIAPTLKNQAGSVVGGGNVPLRKALVILQVTLSLLLLVGAGLFMRTLANLRNLHPGFNPDRLLGFEVDPSLSGYSAERSKIFYNRLIDELQAMPGVKAAGMASLRILAGDDWESSVTIQGYNAKEGEHPLPYMNSVGPGYFKTMGIPVLAGRDFTRLDTRQIKHGDDADNWSPATIMINQKFANKYFRGRNPIGMHLGFGSEHGTKTDMEIIGVVADVKYTSLRDETPIQAYAPYLASHFPQGMTIYVRTSLAPEQLMPVIRRKVQQIDSAVPVYAMRTTEAQIDKSLRTERLVASLSSIFGLLATLLAVIGLYGVMAYTVTRRTREIGIRMALGAMQANVLWMIMKEVAFLILLGTLIGVPLAIFLSRLIQTQLYGLPPSDPATICAATAVLVAVASLAGFVPAVRASRTDPTRALKYE